MQLGKLTSQGHLNANFFEPLVHVKDQQTKQHFVVDIGASFSVFPLLSSSTLFILALFGSSWLTDSVLGGKTIQWQTF
jgi:hypothetical protein